MALFVGKEVGAFAGKLDAIDIIFGSLQGILEPLGHVAEKLVSPVKAEHQARVGHVGGPELTVVFDAFLDEVVEVGGRRGHMLRRDGDPFARVVERHRGDDLLVGVPLPQFVGQFLRDVGPLAAVVAHEDKPLTALGDFHVVDKVIVGAVLLDGIGQRLGYACGVGIVVLAVECQVSAGVGDGHVAATAPFLDVLLDVVAPALCGGGDHQEGHQRDDEG